ncbi:MAG: prolyl oligopeptidase family serine peptidase [Bacteroidales bacterium]|nr:prolyl oligopeptidase family serine peptidase [Bacteroidales bacterium]
MVYRKKLGVLLSVICSLLSLPSCHHIVPELGVDFSQLPNNGKYFVPYSEQTYDVRNEGALPRKASSLNMTDVARGVLESLTSYNIQQICGTYYSTDAYGEPIRLSGAVFYPIHGSIHNIIVCPHYTVAANYEVPSMTFPLEAVLASKGYVVVMPDYIGYGASENQVHPYLQQDLTARNVADMALAVRPFLADRKIVVNNEEIILLGYSQGGSTAMFMQRLLETDEEYKGLFKIKKTYCGGGPYYVDRTYEYCMKCENTGIPYAVPLLIVGMSEGMDEPLDIESFFREPLKSHYKDWLNSKKYNGTQITSMIGTYSLCNILTPEGMDVTNPETHRLYERLQANALPEDYVPQTPMYIFHSKDDQTVPFVNAEEVHNNFERRQSEGVQIRYDFDHYGTHQQGFMKFLTKMLGTL